MSGEVLWEPPADALTSTELGRYQRWLASERGVSFADYDALQRWSVDELEGFWSALWDFYEIRSSRPYDEVLSDRRMPGARWFPGARLNYAEHMLGADGDASRVAVLARSETRPPIELTFGELATQVARCRAGLRRLGVGPGDRVVAYLPNIPEALVAFLATASLGAVWASCSPEFGVRSVVDRFSQVEPSVMLAVTGYTYRGRPIDRSDQVAAIRSGVPSIRDVVHVPYGPGLAPDALAWDELLADEEELAFAQVPFDHPLYVLFTSGTTGLPKPIVHGHGGILVEHLKTMGLTWDLTGDDRLLWYSTTAWMMWNALVSALLVRASIVLVDGDPAWPDLEAHWRLAEETRPTMMGVSPAYLMQCRRTGTDLGGVDLSSIRTIGTAGAPLPAEGYRWVYDQFDPRTLLLNGSGGTDVCSGIVTGSYLQPVYAGEISGRALGVDAHAFDEHGAAVTGELGELVITQPMPSMPVAFWGDTDGERLRSSYFDVYPGVWRHGDWIRFTPRGSCVIAGRSEATLNRGGVRLGTSELYTVVESLDDVTDSLAIHLEDLGGGPGELLLFLVRAAGDGPVAADLHQRVARALREQLSPRHVPDRIVEVPAIPRTLTGKKLETPVKRILGGQDPEHAASRASLVDPSALDAFVAFARTLAQAPGTVDAVDGTA